MLSMCRFNTLKVFAGAGIGMGTVETFDKAVICKGDKVVVGL